MHAAITALIRPPRLHASRLAFFALLCLVLSGLVLAQQPPNASANRVVSVMGFEDMKRNEECELEVGANSIRLKGKKSTVELAPSSIEDVLTGDDSARLVGGFVGTLTSFAPYESGRFLSLFRKKLDTLTIQYRDREGGLHGGILSMKPGQAAPLKKLIVATGARTTVPVEDPPKAGPGSSAGSNRQKHGGSKP